MSMPEARSAAAARTATSALGALAEMKGAFHGGPSVTALDFLSAARDVRAALAPLTRADARSRGEPVSGSRNETEVDSGTFTACRAAFVPALRFHSAVLKRLTRRLGDVLDVAETAALCRAAEAHDRFLEASSKARSRVDLRRQTREALLDLVTRSSGAGRAEDGFGSRAFFLTGGAESETSRVTARGLARAAAEALAEVSSWATRAAVASSDPTMWASRVLIWVAASLQAGGKDLVTAVASRGAGGAGAGAAAMAATLGALRDASSLSAAAAAAPALARAGAALLRAIAELTDEAAVAVGDVAAWKATRRAAYRHLMAPGGALDQLLEVSLENPGAGTGGGARAILAAELAGTMLRGAFAGVPPVAFARHVADARADLARVSLRCVGEWASRREWPADEEDAGDREWRLGDLFAEAGLCAPPRAAKSAPTPRAPRKRKRVEV
jgi:hypothetical protein